MNKELKDKWLVALRSGEFKQGEGYLRKVTAEGEQYCCLGVLCEVAVREGILAPATKSETGWGEEVYGYTFREGYPNATDIAFWDLPEISTSDSHALMNMNDDEQLPFESIANWIEVNL